MWLYQEATDTIFHTMIIPFSPSQRMLEHTNTGTDADTNADTDTETGTRNDNDIDALPDLGAYTETGIVSEFDGLGEGDPKYYGNHTARNTGYWPMASRPRLGADTDAKC